jgi:hypothetical protein
LLSKAEFPALLFVLACLLVFSGLEPNLTTSGHFLQFVYLFFGALKPRGYLLSSVITLTDIFAKGKWCFSLRLRPKNTKNGNDSSPFMGLLFVQSAKNIRKMLAACEG